MVRAGVEDVGVVVAVLEPALDDAGVRHPLVVHPRQQVVDGEDLHRRVAVCVGERVALDLPRDDVGVGVEDRRVVIGGAHRE